MYPAQLGLYTILPVPILYGLWHTQGGSARGVFCAIAVRRPNAQAGEGMGPRASIIAHCFAARPLPDVGCGRFSTRYSLI